MSREIAGDGREPQRSGRPRADERPKVLLADPFEDGRRMVAILLETAGYEVFECVGGHDTFSAAGQWSPDVIVLSTTSHGDELEVVRRLRDMYPDAPPVMLVSGFHSDPFHSRALDAGCAGCLRIPIDFGELLGELARVLGNSAPRPVSGPTTQVPTFGPARPPAQPIGRSEPRARVRTLRPGGRVARVEKLAVHLRNRGRLR